MRVWAYFAPFPQPERVSRLLNSTKRSHPYILCVFVEHELSVESVQRSVMGDLELEKHQLKSDGMAHHTAASGEGDISTTVRNCSCLNNVA